MNDTNHKNEGQTLTVNTSKDYIQEETDKSDYLERLSTAFMASARRWEMVVYPSLFAFILLSVYGFFLIYSLTEDANIMAREMVAVSQKAEVMSQNMVVMTQLMAEQQKSMSDMAMSVRGINLTTHRMGQDVSMMNHSISRPLSVMNGFLPWGQ